MAGSRIKRWFIEEKAMIIVGLLGFVLALFCTCLALVTGADRPPDGNLWHAFSFDAALGIFMLSTAAVMPFSGLGRRSKGIFRWSYIVLVIYCYAQETIQHVRGVNPRYPENGSTFDDIAAGIFIMDAFLLVLFYLWFAISFFKRSAFAQHPELVLSIRYAMASIMVSFAGGISIAMNESRMVGAEGNLITLHGLGFHAIQALPIIAALAAGATLAARVRLTLVHVAGSAYFVGLLAIGWQTMLGRPLLEWSALPLTAAACYVLVAVACARALFVKRAHDGRSQSGHPGVRSDTGSDRGHSV
ncbi:hypothetical protein ACX1C1_02060 [Paenibacillus sp. strain BS8-2]